MGFRRHEQSRSLGRANGYGIVPETQRLLWCGAVGPAAFIVAWIVGSATSSVPYSAIDDPISRLAAVDAPTRALMTSGFLIFGAAGLGFAIALRRLLPGSAWVAAAATALATALVAATPLDSSETVDRLHGLSATAGYVTLIALPVLAARPLLRLGFSTLARFGILAATVATIALSLTLTDLPTGLLQRIGLTSVDLWMIATSARVRRHRPVETQRADHHPTKANSN